ncbi:MAG TPA: FtsX-like permease family protein [Bryobacteraceae bacterium]|nr:FtsX-like permease family protein [Bryobacteraceae bacterium]
MLIRFIQESLRRTPRRKILLIAAIAMGSAVATAMLGVMLSIGDKVNQELRAVGANISVTSKTSKTYLAEADALKVKKIFWALNITAFSPSLTAGTVQGVWFNHPYSQTETTGLRTLNRNWKITGAWASDDAQQCMAGQNAARRNNWQPGATVHVLNLDCQLTGIISAGDEVDDRVLLPLALVQQALNKPGLIDRIDVAALTKPEDDFARKDPRTMTPAEFERWNCTNYVVSIAHEIEEAIPGTQAHPVRRVADSEGKILGKIGGLMALITLAALLSAGLTVWSLTAAILLERRAEIAIMQAIGGTRLLIASILGLETVLIAAAGGAIGAATGVWLAGFVGRSVFNGNIDISPVLPLVVVLAAVLVGLAGAAQPLTRALHLDPAVILREGI